MKEQPEMPALASTHPGRSSWSVVSTVAEPLPLLMAFVAHHLKMGASEVILHLDSADEPTARCLGEVEGCRVVMPVDAQAGVHMPTPTRQVRNAVATMAEAKTEWLLHIDADEFLVDMQHVQHALDTAPSALQVIGIRPAERVWRTAEPVTGLFDGTFRLLIPHHGKPSQESLYGESAVYLDQGFSGNGLPKCFVRTNSGLEMGVDFPKTPEGAFVEPYVLAQRCLLHFDGATPANYIAKLQRKIEQQPNWSHFPSPGRREQLLEVWKAGTDQARLSQLTTAAKFITPEQEAALDAAGLLYAPPFEPGVAIRDVFGINVDLSVAMFDSLPLARRRIGRMERARNAFRSWRRLRKR